MNGVCNDDDDDDVGVEDVSNRERIEIGKKKKHGGDVVAYRGVVVEDDRDECDAAEGERLGDEGLLRRKRSTSSSSSMSSMQVMWRIRAIRPNFSRKASAALA